MTVSRPLEPIRRSAGSLGDAVYQRIIDAILVGDIVPGARLVMDQLAEELDISRTPVRDALRRLEREGLLEPAGRRGYAVRAVNDADVLHVYELREAVEGFAARRVAEIGASAIDRVAAVVDECGARGSMGRRSVYDLNLRIHRAVVEAIENPALTAVFDDIWLKAKGLAIWADYLAHEVTPESVREEHLPLVTALREGPEQAFVAMRSHIRGGLRVHAGPLTPVRG